MTAKVALLLEDEAIIALDVEVSLMERGFSVHVAQSCLAAMEWLDANPSPSVAVIDVELVDGPCDDVAKELTKRRVPFVVHSGAVLPQVVEAAFSGGVLLPKPSATADLLAAVERAMTASLPS